MKFITSIVLTGLVSFTACLFMPWWSIAVSAFIVAVLIPQKAGISFLSAFIAVAVFWAALSFWISNTNGHILAHKISLLILKIDNPAFLIILTAFIGGLVAGFAALTGSYLKKK